MQEEQFYRIGQAAQLLGVTTNQLHKYTREGLINAEYVAIGSGIQRARRYKGGDLEAFASSNPELVGLSESAEISPITTPFPSWPESGSDSGILEESQIEVEVEEEQESDSLADHIPAAPVNTNGEESGNTDPVNPNPSEELREQEITTSIMDSDRETNQTSETISIDDIVPEPVTEQASSEIVSEEILSGSAVESSVDSGIGIAHFVFGLGATGVQIVDQARRSDFYARENNSQSLETAYRFFIMDTSIDIDPERAFGKNHTEEGLGKWFERDDILILSNLTGGAGRVPVVSEFIAEHALERKIKETTESEARLNGINTTYLVHSIGGGTGCGLAPRLGRWLSDQRRGGSRISLTLLGKSDGAVMNDVEASNSLYAFPRLNESMDLAILIDNETVFKRYVSDERTGIETERYLQELESSILSGLPNYIEQPERLYVASDRYTYRIMSSLNRLPEDITNILTFYRGNKRFYSGAKWAIPFLYPLNADYEYDYRDIPPALMVLRALQKGGLCSPSQIRPDSLIAIICEYPEDYPMEYVMRLIQDAQNIASDLLSIIPSNIRIVPVRSSGNGFSVTALMVGSEPEIFEQWLRDSSDPDKRNKIKSVWNQRVSSGGDNTGSGDAWANIAQQTAAALLDEEEEQNELADRIRADAIQWREEASKVDICETFIEFATRTGFVTAGDAIT